MTFVKREFSHRQQMSYQQTDLNRNVLSCHLKASSEMSGVCRSTGRLFHIDGKASITMVYPGVQNLKLIQVGRLQTRMARMIRRRLAESRQCGDARLWTHLSTSRAVLNSILWRTGNQCRSCKTGIIRSNLLVLVMSRAAALCIVCSLCSSWPLITAKTLLQ